MKEELYRDVVKEWKNRYKRITYRGNDLCITVLYNPKPKDLRAFYVGILHYTPEGEYWSKITSFESIHYDKVVSRFQRFVDEYCTDWVVKAILQYKGYEIKISREVGCKDFYIGYVKFHENSIYKYIANNREEVEVSCKNRIDRVVKEKEKVQRKMLTPKQEKIQELEQLQARISAQLEELKNEKETLEYKGVVLEYGKEEGLDKGYMIGRIKNAPEGTRYFYRKVVSNMQCDFEEYIDKLEEAANLYCILTGKEVCIISK